jgi:DNA mismatch endonuclease (patch repair protein)
MVDVHTREQRIRNMSAIRGRDTKPEILVRSLLHSMGFRFRLHLKNLPGKPDIVLPVHKAVIFVHGCFWHCHKCRFGLVKPATRPEFWVVKRQSNVERDIRNKLGLEALGWRVMIVWECETRERDQLRAQLAAFLTPAGGPGLMLPILSS